MRRKTSRALRNLLDNCRVRPLAEPPAWIKQLLCPTWCRMPHPGVQRRRFYGIIGMLRHPEKKPIASIAERARGSGKSEGPTPGSLLPLSALLRCPSSSSSLLLLFSHFLFTFPHLTFSLVSSFLSLSTRRPGCDSGQPSPLNSVGGIPCSRVHTPSPGLSFPQTTRRCP